MKKKLCRVTEGKKLCGVCGGIAEYFSIDPTLVRVLFALAGLFWFTGILAYIVLAVVMPEDTTLY